jgi:hypothetical protein
MAQEGRFLLPRLDEREPAARLEDCEDDPGEPGARPDIHNPFAISN